MITAKTKTQAIFLFKSGRLLNEPPLRYIDLTSEEINELGSFYNRYFVSSENRIELFNDDVEELYKEWLNKFEESL